MATDLSGEAIRDVSRSAQKAGLHHASFLERAADDFTGIPEASFDVVVLNEVLHYFPTVDYLVKVIEGALAVLKPGGVLYVGGVRSLPLLELFAASVERFRAPGTLDVAELRGGSVASRRRKGADGRPRALRRPRRPPTWGRRRLDSAQRRTPSQRADPVPL